jgi:hypothetical protein
MSVLLQAVPCPGLLQVSPDVRVCHFCQLPGSPLTLSYSNPAVPDYYCVHSLERQPVKEIWSRGVPSLFSIASMTA